MSTRIVRNLVRVLISRYTSPLKSIILGAIAISLMSYIVWSPVARADLSLTQDNAVISRVSSDRIGDNEAAGPQKREFIAYATKKSSDTYTETEEVSWIERIFDSFLALVGGVAMFFGSFFVLYWNEGRLDLSLLAKTAVEISPSTPDTASIGKLISTTGSVTSEELLGDNLFLTPGKYIAASREVEMFAWEEDEKTDTRKNVGGSETRTTTYTYSKRWQNYPEDSSSFKKSEGHYNPPKEIQDFDRRVQEARVGIVSLDIGEIDLPQFDRLRLSEENIILDDGISLVDNYLFKGNGSLSNPNVGDLRIYYNVIPNGLNVTVFGKLESSDRIAPYLYQDEHRFYRILAGSRTEAIATLKREHQCKTWIYRLVGFMMMWWGPIFVSQPISVILDFFPVLGSISQFIAVWSAFAIALVLSSITILVSILLHLRRKLSLARAAQRA